MRTYPDQKRLKELFDYSSAAFELNGEAFVGGLVWRVRYDRLYRPNVRQAGKFAGTVRCADGRVQIGIDGKLYELNRLVAIWHGCEIDGLLVDHKDRNTRDSRIENLRVATNSQNNQNMSPKGGTSRYVGVYWNAARGKWQAQIKLKGKPRYAGLFIDEEEAAKARDKLARCLHGAFAVLNFPEASDV
jgi:hypothetical protein